MEYESKPHLREGSPVLFLAGELQKKAYPVTVFCNEEDLAAFFDAETGFLSTEGREASLTALKGMDIKFRFTTDLSQMEALWEGFDMVCAQWGLAEITDGDNALMYSRERNLVTGETSGVLDAAFGAKKAALTVDRLAQNLDPTNTRGDEGTMETKLFVDLTEVEPSQCRITAGTREEAVEEAKRCIQCTCDACFKACAYLRHYKKYPRALTREIHNNVNIIMGDHMMNKPINACAICGQCSAVCPNGYDVGAICKAARENMVFTGKSPEQEEDPKNAKECLWDYLDWFSEKMDGKLTCLDILNRDMGSRLETCPDLIGESYEKIMEILERRNLI